MADAGGGQPGPGKLLAGVLLAARRHVRVGEHALGANAVTSDDVLAQGFHGLQLRLGKVGIAAIMAGIVDLDADRGGVYVSLAGPDGLARVPGPHLLRHHLRDAALLVDGIVAGDLTLHAGQPVDGVSAGRHAGVVQQQDVGAQAAPPRAEVGRGDELAGKASVGPGDQSPRSLAMAS